MLWLTSLANALLYKVWYERGPLKKKTAQKIRKSPCNQRDKAKKKKESNWDRANS